MIAAYFDSSVILRRFFSEPNQMRGLEKYDAGCSSVVSRIECARALDRALRMGRIDTREFAEIRSGMTRFMDSLSLVPVSDEVVEIAAGPFSSPVRTLDALHMASAQIWRRLVRVEPDFLTHDAELATVARGAGFNVAGA